MMQYETLKLKLVSLVNNFCGSISLEVRDSSGEPILAYNERDVPDSQHDQSMCKIVSVNINKRSKASIRLALYSIIQRNFLRVGHCFLSFQTIVPSKIHF